uniref:J domain-containing protein n=1 Tax=Globodera pallida TaxID=36090 RepID=A0A183C541_GLOPA
MLEADGRGTSEEHANSIRLTRGRVQDRALTQKLSSGTLTADGSKHKCRNTALKMHPDDGISTKARRDHGQRLTDILNFSISLLRDLQL